MNTTTLTRRDWIKATASLGVATLGSPRLSSSALAEDQTASAVRDICSRRELFVDRFLIGQENGTQLKLHEPQLAPAMSEPADNLEYGTVIKDGDLFRLYTRDGRGAKFDGDAPEVTFGSSKQKSFTWPISPSEAPSLSPYNCLTLHNMIVSF